MQLQNNQLEVSTTFEHNIVSHTENKQQHFIVTLKAPEINIDKRSPVDIVCVIDKSGSMSGQKLELVKKTLGFMVEKILNSSDRVALVSFDTHVEVDFTLAKMSSDGKEHAQKKISKLTSGSSTNLSGGLLEGISQLVNRKDSNDVSSILLFTDGLANCGLLKTDEIVEVVKKEIGKLNKPTNIFTFGFGNDHDANMLKSISDSSNGTYCYVKNEDEIPSAFANCLGGLLSVFAQNIKVKIKTSYGVKLLEVLADAYKTKLEERSCEIVLGDIFSEEKKDLLLVIDVPKLDIETRTHKLFEVKVDYFNIVSKSSETVDIYGCVSRPREEHGQLANHEVDKQINRVYTNRSIKSASLEADQKKMDEAKSILGKQITKIKSSVSANDQYCIGLVKDLEDLVELYADYNSYERRGITLSCGVMSQGNNQRTTFETKSSEIYSTSGQQRMKSMFDNMAKPSSEPYNHNSVTQNPLYQSPEQTTDSSGGIGAFFNSLFGLSGSNK